MQAKHLDRRPHAARARASRPRKESLRIPFRVPSGRFCVLRSQCTVAGSRRSGRDRALLRRPVHAQRGFTLVEVLLALLLLGIILTASLGLVRQNLVVEQALRAQDTVRLDEDVFFEFIRRDFDGIIGHEAALSAPSGTLLQLRTLAWFVEDQAEGRRLLPADVTYALEAHTTSCRLVRTQQDRTQAESVAERMVLLRDVESVRLRVHTDKGWVEPDDSLPRLASSAWEVTLTRVGRPPVRRVYLRSHPPIAPGRDPRAR